MIEVTESGIVIVSKAEQFLKAVELIDFTEFGITMLFKLSHSSKVSPSIRVIELESVTLVKFVQYLKASLRTKLL